MRNLALICVLAGVVVALLAAGDGKPPVSTFTDKRDGKVYKIVKIGSQVWFAENLNYAAEGSVCRYNKIDNCAKYGRLYNWETALSACPNGTHLPTDKEWTTLMDYAGGERKAGTKLKSTDWKSYKNTPAGTDEYGFAALLGGYGKDGFFGYAACAGCWWSATGDVADSVWHWSIYHDFEVMLRRHADKTFLFSVRCVLDDEKEKRK